ncbi:ABC transporter substrate-binding protein [Anaeromicropila herbilytica]|uniref:Sugar ABC transporter substrate-binding protein n=1 Tax=Anaeromicropila herbilytica TaxID=2785025 RepID=A0A7R7ELN1_9FIRM|nr:sugar ABC transporter substrate-binding protein [Anaeromicropila herbilytica]BCN30886.1 sugar ABC transporter substrate-binding protein [Anaeromicropila herbilytica]
MKIRKFISILMIMLMVFSLAACKNNTKETSTSDGKSDSKSDDVVTINFYEHSDNETIAKALVDAYNAQSKNVKVKLSIIANDDYDDKTKVMLSGGADIDCFWIRGGAQTRQLAETGALLSLNDLNKENNVDITSYGDMGQAFVDNGNTYGLCTSKSCWLLWYNKDLFDAAGISYPVNLTWEDFTQLAKSLTKDDKYGCVVPNWTMNLGATAVGEYLTDENLTKTKEYAKYQERWYVTDKSSPSIEDMTGSFDINSFFAEGNTYMMINGDWTFLNFPDSKPGFTWCAAPLPIFDDATKESTVGGTSCFSVSAKSKHPKEAYDFIKFCCYSDAGASIYAQNSTVPAFPSDAALDIYKQKVTVPGAEYVFSAKVSLEQGLDSNYEELNTAFKEELNDSLVGNATLDQAFKNYEQRRDEINSKK